MFVDRTTMDIKDKWRNMLKKEAKVKEAAAKAKQALAAAAPPVNEEGAEAAAQ